MTKEDTKFRTAPLNWKDAMYTNRLCATRNRRFRSVLMKFPASKRKLLSRSRMRRTVYAMRTRDSSI